MSDEPLGSTIARRITSRIEEELARPLEPGLYVVSTPIGNISDITLRALTVLARADIVYCEDTRHSKRLLTAYGLAPKQLRYDDHTGDKMRPQILQKLADGASLALISDAGTPLISDPGFKLVRAVLEAGYPVRSVPGPSAAIAGLSVSGLPTAPFFFEGFLPPKPMARRKRLAQLANMPASLIFYEAPTRVLACLTDMLAELGDRQVAVLRELTKKFEETMGGTLSAVLQQLSQQQKLRGEFVIVTAPPSTAKKPSRQEIEAAFEDLLDKVSFRDAVRRIAAQFDLPRKQVYELGLALTTSRCPSQDQTPGGEPDNEPDGA